MHHERDKIIGKIAEKFKAQKTGVRFDGLGPERM